MQKISSKEQGARTISSGRQQRVARIDPAPKAEWTVRAEEVSTDLAVEADPVIWIARPKTGRVVTFRASGSRAFRAGALIDPAGTGEGLVVIAPAAAEALAGVIASVVTAVDLGAAASADSVVAEEDSAVFAAAADDEN